MNSKRKTNGSTSSKIGMAFLIPGIFSLVFSIFYESQILAFLGLGLTFWGALFLLLRPVKHVEASLLDSAAISSYSTIDRIIRDFQYKGKGCYIPPYPGDVYLPEHLKGLKDTLVFISATDTVDMPSIEELAEGKFMLENPQGVLVTPPGSGFLTQIEKRLDRDFAKIGLNELCDVLPRFILENFQLAKEIEMTVEENHVHLKLFDSLFKNLYSKENNLTSVNVLGCPIVSAVACALAKVTSKPVIIQDQKVSPDGLTVEVWYQTVQS